MSDSATLFTDGACKGNPGPSAIGVLIVDDEGVPLAEISERVGRRTNNEAEYLALIRGLEEAALLGIRRLRWVSDSELLVRQWKGTYKVRAGNLAPLLAKARVLAQRFESFSAGHTLREGNRHADRLANLAFQQE